MNLFVVIIGRAFSSYTTGRAQQVWRAGERNAHYTEDNIGFRVMRKMK